MTKEEFIKKLDEGEKIRLTTAREGRMLTSTLTKIKDEDGIKGILTRYDGDDIIV